MDSVLGRARNIGRSVSASREPTHSAVLDLPAQRVRNGFGWPPVYAEAVVAQGINQLGDGRWTVVNEMHGERVTELDSSKASLIHR